MSRVLNDNVHVDGVMYPKGSSPVGEAAARIGDHAWVEVGVAPAPVVVPLEQSQFTPEERGPSQFTAASVPIPNRKGANSSKDAWVAYAASVGVEVDPVDSRDDIILTLEIAEKPTE